MTSTINDTTITYTQATDTGSEPAAAAGDGLTPALADQHPDRFAPRSGYARFASGQDDLEVSADPKTTLDDPPSYPARAGHGS